MDANLKARWLAALRSGKYEQAIGYLKLKEGSQNKFCCLGVLCRLQDKNFEERYKYKDGLGTFILAPEDSAGLTAYQREFLSRMNDSGFSFNNIANYIEDNY